MKWGDMYGAVWYKDCSPIDLNELKPNNWTQIFLHTTSICEPLPDVEYRNGVEYPNGLKYWGPEYDFDGFYFNTHYLISTTIENSKRGLPLTFTDGFGVKHRI